MLAFCRSSLKLRKHFIISPAFTAITGLGTHVVQGGNGLPCIDNRTLARLAQQRPVIILFRRAERCGHSTSQYLLDKTGIAVKGTQDARGLGNAFSVGTSDPDLRSSNTVRTIQSTVRSSADKKLVTGERFPQCGNEIHSAIRDL